MRCIEGTLRDVETLSSYLHDSDLSADDAAFDSSSGQFRLTLNRVGYEYGQPARSILGRPLRRYPLVPAALAVSSAEGFEWIPDSPRTPEDARTLLRLAHVGGSLRFETLGGTLVVRVADSCRLTLCDIGEPNPGRTMTRDGDSGVSVLEDIGRLMRDA